MVAKVDNAHSMAFLGMQDGVSVEQGRHARVLLVE